MQSSPSQMDSNSAVSSSKEHRIGTADNEERREKTRGERERGVGGRLGSPVLPIRGGGGGGGGGAGRLACTAAFIFLAKSRKVHASINL